MGIMKFNKSEVLFTNNGKYEQFKTLEELFTKNGHAKKYLVTGVFNYKSSYGEGCFIRTDGFNISLPTHLVETIKQIREDAESIEQINQGIVYIEIYSYTLPDKYPDKTFYSINFIV